MRKLCLFTVLIACAVSHAQTSSLRTQLERAYELGWNEDMEGAEAILSGISDEDILAEDDSTKYLFYYCMAGLLDYKEQSPELKSEYIDKAIRLRETSVGVLSSEYLELLWAKGTDIYEQDVNQAIRIFEKGLVIGQSCLGSNDRSSLFWYGQIMSYLAECYKQKGYEKELVSLCNQSFNILAPHYDVEDEDDHTSLVPLTILEIYYWEQAKYNENIELCDRALTFLSGHGGADTENYANFLYYKANSLHCLGRISEAAETYEKVADIMKTRYGNKAELLQLDYGNWYIMLAENGMDDEAAEIEPALIECHIGNLEELASAFYTAAKRLYKKADYASSLKYMEKVDPYMEQLSDESQETIYQFKSLIQQQMTSDSSASEELQE